ncbi:hypothetical protein COU20_00035, partial [Candidatus Kaiserbacteria bacterium CG10_big_fil_rev_8_21_14_0_10_59_10]
FRLHVAHSDAGEHPHMLELQNSASGGGQTYLGVSATGASIGAGKFYIADNSNYRAVVDLTSGKVGIGTTTPTEQLSIKDLLFVGAGGATGMGTATSTFQGDIRILGKLDVGTIDPVYTIDGVKYATYGHSTVGVKEEAAVKVSVREYDAARKLYKHAIRFSELREGSDLWLFYQTTDFGADWEHLVVTLTPAFNGRVFYEESAATNTLTLWSDTPGSVSLRLVANRYDHAKWPNLRPDQDDDFTHHILRRK